MFEKKFGYVVLLNINPSKLLRITRASPDVPLKRAKPSVKIIYKTCLEMKRKTNENIDKTPERKPKWKSQLGNVVTRETDEADRLPIKSI